MMVWGPERLMPAGREPCVLVVIRICCKLIGPQMWNRAGWGRVLASDRVYQVQIRLLARIMLMTPALV